MSSEATPLTRASVRRSSSVSPAKGKQSLLRTGSINFGAASASSSVSSITQTSSSPSSAHSTPPDSPVNKPRYMWETATSSFRTVVKQAELAKEASDDNAAKPPMYFTDIHTMAKKEDSHVIAGLLAQLAEKEAVIMEQAAAIDSKDVLIQKFTATCDRLKHDCEALADKAFEWKLQYVALAAANAAAPTETSAAHALTGQAVDDIDVTRASPAPDDGGGEWRPALSRRASRNRSRHLGIPLSSLPVESPEAARTDRWSDAGSATVHFQELLAQKDRTIQEYTVACTKYKQDCDMFCAKAMEWKKKHDVVAKQVLQLQADVFLLQGQRRHSPQAVATFEAPRTPESLSEVYPSPVHRPPSPRSPPLVVNDDVAELKLVHAREVETLKSEVSRLHELSRLHEMDTVALSEVRTQLETYNVTAEAEFEQLEREVAQFKAQILVLGQDNADQLLELTAKHAIHDCARTAQEKQRQWQWNQDRLELNDLLEKMAHQQRRLAHTMTLLDESKAVCSDLNAEVKQIKQRHDKLERSHKTLLQQHVRAVATLHERTRHMQKLIQKNLLLKRATGTMAQEHVAASSLKVSRGMEASTAEVQSELGTGQCHDLETAELKSAQSTTAASTRQVEESEKNKLLRRLKGLQDSLLRGKIREQHTQGHMRELRRQLHVLRRNPSVHRNEVGHTDETGTLICEQAALKRQVELYKCAIAVIIKGVATP
ncbi:hypothetical protein DYB28_007190 [Aphanomyces astaci]|uniref:Uncharacterized protein n=1 Tax=Aphanomyces astaci TaxID=112090 RepID=A0A9X8H909_APHAT|nr:hypothetical protein DYB28_007190 [Aphanomyces astaci]